MVNGEVYDFDRLRQVLTDEHGYHFKSHSDSEVLVALYKVYGAPDFIEHVRGEFAFILYDERRDLVIAGRDRFGIKPLHWTFVRDESGEKRLLVASEAKAFLPLGWQPEWDVGAIVDGGYMNGERTVFKDVHKVLPGCWLEMHGDGTVHHHRYWDMEYNEKVRAAIMLHTDEECFLILSRRIKLKHANLTTSFQASGSDSPRPFGSDCGLTCLSGSTCPEASILPPWRE